MDPPRHAPSRKRKRRAITPPFDLWTKSLFSPTTTRKMHHISPQVHHHPDPLTTLLPHLIPLLPTSLPLLRRIQFHYQSPHALVLSTLPLDYPAPAPRTRSPPFTALYLDRSRAPETEAWLYSSTEAQLDREKYTADEWAFAAPKRDALAYRELVAVLGDVAKRGVGEWYSGEGARLLRVGALGEGVLRVLRWDMDRVDNLVSGDVITGRSMLGAAGDPRDGVRKIVADGSDEEKAAVQVGGPNNEGNPTGGGVIRGHTIPYTKFIFDAEREPSGEGAGELALPAGLVWSKPTTRDITLVRSRSSIPRSESTLSFLPSLGIRDSSSENLIAWAFLGVDASLSSLHVESEYRRRGLAKLITQRLFGKLARGEVREYRALEGSARWAHSDVAPENVASVRVAQGLGGQEGWRCYWALVDLAKVREVVDKAA